MSGSFQTFNSVTIKTHSTLVIHVQLRLYSTVILGKNNKIGHMTTYLRSVDQNFSFCSAMICVFTVIGRYFIGKS